MIEVILIAISPLLLTHVRLGGCSIENNTPWSVFSSTNYTNKQRVNIQADGVKIIQIKATK